MGGLPKIFYCLHAEGLKDESSFSTIIISKVCFVHSIIFENGVLLEETKWQVRRFLP